MELKNLSVRWSDSDDDDNCEIRASIYEETPKKDRIDNLLDQ